jgi:Methyltransferase domain
VKALIKKTLASFDYAIRRLPERDDSNDPAPTDDLIAGPWFSHVLQMANQHYRPNVLHYRRGEIEDERLKYIAYFLDVRDQRILEIGPFEGYHSVILEKMGVRENISIESRPENLRKCVRVKEKYQLSRTQFLQHDLERLYRAEDRPSFGGHFDLVFCLGVLYHLPDPGSGLKWMRSQSSTLFLGTHYATRRNRMKNVIYSYKERSYHGKELVEGGISDPISGMSPSSIWLYQDDLLRLLQDVGYSRISVLGKDIQNHRDHITLLAEA